MDPCRPGAACPWPGWLPGRARASLALTADGPAAMGEREFLDALLAVERRGLAEYEAALASLDEDARELVELELIPRQRRHVDALCAMLDRLAA